MYSNLLYVTLNEGAEGMSSEEWKCRRVRDNTIIIVKLSVVVVGKFGI